MAVRLATLLASRTLVSRVFNRVCNLVASLLVGQRTYVDWTDLKVIHPERIAIGRNFACGRSLWLEAVHGQGQIIIGDDVNISDWVHIGAFGKVSIGCGVLIGSKVIITDHSHGESPRSRPEQLDVYPNQRPIFSKGEVKIDAGVWLGDNVSVLGACHIGEAAIVGANSVVLSNIPARTVWAGIPAKQLWPIC